MRRGRRRLSALGAGLFLIAGALFAATGHPDVLIAGLVTAAFLCGPEVPRMLRSRHPARTDAKAFRRRWRLLALSEVGAGLAMTTAYPLAWRENGVAARSPSGATFRHDPGTQFVMGLASLAGVAFVIIGIVEFARTPRD